MGLDIYHFKATLLPPEEISCYSDNFYTASNYHNFDVPIEYFHPYFQLITFPKVQFSIVIPFNLANLAQIYAGFKDEKHTHILLENQTQAVKAEIKKLEREMDLKNLSKSMYQTDMYKQIDYVGWVQEEGFYSTNNVAYQRKGMNAAFADRFYHRGDIYHFTQKEDFDFALQCVDFYWDSDTEECVAERKRAFQSDFVDKYEANCSWMALSY